VRKIVFYKAKILHFLREALFIKKNKERWEKLQEDPSREADEMAKDFTKLVDDLAYAKTFYPTSKVTRLINSQAAKIYLDIYKNRKEESNRLVTFWKYDLPLTIRRHHAIIFLVFIVFTVFFAIGFFSSSVDEQFVREVMGDEYVSMTEKNIQDKNPFGVYQSGNSLLSWIWIMIHNILVTLRYFLEGIVLGIISMIDMSKFAISIGAFEQMFFKSGYGLQSVLIVSLHGVLELSAAIIGTAGGVVMGTSYLFPGTLKRWQAFKKGTKDGVKIVIGVIPVLIIAAFFEGFVTRHAGMPVWLSGSLFLLSVSAVSWYFVIYPIRLQRKFSQSLNMVGE
jgi:uncharacterized membrane protein SpoIIM required for sporulation